MRLLPTAPLLVAFYLLASAATARAECSWVLWSKVAVTYGQSSPQIEWQISGTEMSKEACLAFMRRELQARLANGWEATLDYWPTHITSTLKSGNGTETFFTRDYSCLPDTVDPRGPRGDAR